MSVAGEVERREKTVGLRLDCKEHNPDAWSPTIAKTLKIRNENKYETKEKIKQKEQDCKKLLNEILTLCNGFNVVLFWSN